MIRKIIQEDTYTHRYIDDVKRLQRVMLANGYESDLSSAANIWEELSDSYAAGWLYLPEDDEELWSTIERRVIDAAV